MSAVNPSWHPNTSKNTPKHPHMAITNFNYEDSYLPGFICHIVVKADLGRSVSRSTPHPQMHLMQSEKASLMTTPKCPGIQIWQINLCLPMDPPQYQSRNALGVQIWQMNLHLPMDPPSTRAEMPWIPVHKTWLMNLHLLMDPPVPEQKCLEYQYTKLGRWTYFGWWTPPVQLGRWTYFGQCYWHLVVKHDTFTLLLTYTGQEWQFHIATDI